MSTKTLKIKKVTIIGVIPSFAFQRAKHYSIELHKNLPQRYPLPEIKGMLEFDWNEKLQEWRRTMDREFWCIRRPVVVFFDDRFIGSDVDLIRTTSYGNTYYENIPRKNMSTIKQDMKEDYYAHLKKSKRLYCFLDICIDDVYVGALTFQLFSDILPQTCDHFKNLCFERYKGSKIHRVVKKGWIQGGKLKKFKQRIPDENYGMSHNRRGIISMVSDGKNNIGSQFFISLKPLPWLDGCYVAFGQLIEGVGALEAIENVETNFESPLQKIEIKNCGELILEKEEKIRKKLEEIKEEEKLETVVEQILRLIMEAVTACLVLKEHPLDVLDDRDVPSEMDLTLYFQGFYSIPYDIIEEVAAYIREMKRDLLRNVQPAATDTAEIIIGDLIRAVVTNLTTLDDVRETLGHALYNKMLKNIDMNIDSKEKDHVRKFIDQLVETAGKIIEALWRKLEFFRTHNAKFRKFEKGMNDWMNNFVMQKSFIKFFLPEPEPETDVNQEEKREEEEIFFRDEICGDIDNADDASEFLPRTTAEFFNECRYELKYPHKPKRKNFLKMLKTSRKKLKELRIKFLDPDVDRKAIEDPRLEKRLKRYLTGVQYVPESEWLRDLLFNKKTRINHVDNIMCGALTVALLEMYYLYEDYLKNGPIEPPPPPPVLTKARKITLKKKTPQTKKLDEAIIVPIDEIFPVEETAPADLEPGPEPEPSKTLQCPSCKCMDSYCDCICDPKWSPDLPQSSPRTLQPADDVAPSPLPPPPPPLPPPFPPPPSEEPELTEPEEDVKVTDLEGSVKSSPGQSGPCPPGMEPFNIESILADKEEEPLDIRSFKWLGDYITNEGCEAKSTLATRVHQWLHGEEFNYSGLLSKHSLATRASILSLSFSLASLIQEDNNFKADVRNFIYDLWHLYFGELFKETLYENWSKVNSEDLDYDYERTLQPYSPPSWIKFITAETKRALGVLAKLSSQSKNELRITPSELAFDENLKMWYESSNSYKKSKPLPDEVLEYISYHKVDLKNLESTVRSYLKKKVISGLMDKGRRKGTAEDLASEMVIDVVKNVMKKNEMSNNSAHSIVNDLIAAVIKSDSMGGVI